MRLVALVVVVVTLYLVLTVGRLEKGGLSPTSLASNENKVKHSNERDGKGSTSDTAVQGGNGVLRDISKSVSNYSPMKPTTKQPNAKPTEVADQSTTVLNSTVKHPQDKTSIAGLTATTSQTSSINSSTRVDFFSAKELAGYNFAPFPHQSLPVEEAAICDWTTQPSVIQHPSLLLNRMDKIQRAAFSEGVCLPLDTTTESLHIFSTSEAIECLSQADRIMVTGDSYTKQLFLGLHDVLTGDASNLQIRNSTVRNKILQQTRDSFQQRHREANVSFPAVDFVCDPECFGKPFRSETRPFQTACVSCLSQELGSVNVSKIAVFVGVGIHILNDNQKSVHMALRTVKAFLEKMSQGVVLVSMPSYNAHVSKIPEQYRTSKSHGGHTGQQMYQGMLDATREYNHSFLDVYHLTQTCFMDNCSLDGTHRTRFVNRWKAQLALNMICRREST